MDLSSDESAGARSTLSASGKQSCPAGQVPWVKVDLIDPGTVNFYKGSTFVGSTGVVSTAHIHTYYGTTTANWKVTSTTGIATVADGCQRS